MNDLETATTDELVAELRKRFDRFVLVYERDETNEESATGLFWKGTHSNVLGLIQYADIRFQMNMVDSIDEAEEDDEDD